MSRLPIDPVIPEVIAAARSGRRLVLVAPPGAGKTTRVPPALLGAGVLSADHPTLVLLQPRRVAARASAARIAAENGWTIGQEVGYQIRFERRIGPATRLRVVTEGILTRQLLADPFLEGVGAVVLDEFHERSLDTDLALGLLREVRSAGRDDLIVVVMSATLDPEPIARFLDDAPILRAEGRPFPVEATYLPAPTARTPMHDQVARALALVLEENDGPGDVLVFLPGMEEIRRAARALEPLGARADLLVLPLHGSLPAEAQDRALRPADRRKVILATNVAETSLTIEGVSTVIDSGLARVARHDPARGLDRLELVRISRASAAQRAGRAGRTGPGRCIRLWSARDDRGLAEFDVPEIRRVDLASTVLALHAWGIDDPARFGWFEAPPAEALSGADHLLKMLGALDARDGRITPIGRELLRFPVHPRIGRLLLGAGGLRFEAATLAALLSEKDILGPTGPAPGSGPGPPRSDSKGRGRSDLLARLDLIEESERSRFDSRLRARGVDLAAVRRVIRARDDLLRSCRGRPGQHASAVEDQLLKLPLLAYPDRVVRRRLGDESTGLMVGGRGVRLDPGSIVRDPELFLALDPREDRRSGAREARVRSASEVRLEWLEELFPDAIRRDRIIRFDEARGRAIAAQTLMYRDLVISEETHGSVEPAEASAALADWLSARASEFVRGMESAANWLDRVACLRSWMPELDLPTFDPNELAEVLATACAGHRSVEEVRRVPLVPLLRGRLTYAQARALDEEAPEALVVPSGSRIRLTYEPGRPPLLAARLQELFGWTETPRLAGGRVPVLLQLLGPNFRPVQVTDDLRSFWASTYFQVRKDLRARYPRHAWPDDPIAARPEARGRRRG